MYIKQKLPEIKRKIKNNMIVGNFKTRFLTMGRSSRQSVRKRWILTINNTVSKMDFTDIYRTVCLGRGENTFFWRAEETFSMTDHFLGHTISRSKFKKTKIIRNIFSDSNGIKLKIKNRRKTEKLKNTWELINTLQNNQLIKEEIKGKIRNFNENNENRKTSYQNLWDSVNTILRGKIRAINGDINKQERSQIDNLNV